MCVLDSPLAFCENFPNCGDTTETILSIACCEEIRTRVVYVRREDQPGGRQKWAHQVEM